MLTPGRHYVNTTVRIDVVFTDDDGNPIDPATVQFDLMSPRMDTTTYVYCTDAALVRWQQGEYFVDVVPTDSGMWAYRWTTTGTGQATVQEGIFRVQASLFAHDMLSDSYR